VTETVFGLFTRQRIINSKKNRLKQPWHAALEALQCGPSTVSEKRYFGAKPNFRKNNPNFGPRVDLGWPWLD
jgi:hypothetical protein